MPGTET